MKHVGRIFVIISILVISTAVHAQGIGEGRARDVLGRICKTGEPHPAPTAEINFDALDYAVCGSGGMRVYPLPAAAAEFNKIKFGKLGEKPGGEFVYLHGRMKQIVMPEFKTPQGWRPRFRHAWLEVDQVRRGLKFASKPRVKKSGDMLNISLDISNPLTMSLSNVEVVLTLRGAAYLQPFHKNIASLAPGQKQTVSFEVPSDGKKPQGEIVIKNYTGDVYIDAVEPIN